VYHKSLEKIKNATEFVIWYRQKLPKSIQMEIQPYLDQPYQLALKILNYCCSVEYCKLEEIAQKLEISKDTTRQIIKALKDGGTIFTINTAKGWKVLEVGVDQECKFAEIMEDVMQHCDIKY
jgi:biotin operon repressor